MPDWKKLVRERMLNLPPDAKEEVISELAAHLEDGYQNELARGLSKSEASQRVLSEIQWHQLARRIRDAGLQEESMTSRTKAVWFPAVVNLFIATILLTLLELLGVHPYIVQVSHMPVAFHLPWLCTLPFSAAAASLLARRANAPAALRLIVGLAPSLLWLAVFVAMAMTFGLDRWQFPTGFPLEFSYFALSVVGWVVLPAIPLLLGTLPFLREPELHHA